MQLSFHRPSGGYCIGSTRGSRDTTHYHHHHRLFSDGVACIPTDSGDGGDVFAKHHFCTFQRACARLVCSASAKIWSAVFHRFDSMPTMDADSRLLLLFAHVVMENIFQLNKIQTGTHTVGRFYDSSDGWLF